MTRLLVILLLLCPGLRAAYSLPAFPDSTVGQRAEGGGALASGGRGGEVFFVTDTTDDNGTSESSTGERFTTTPYLSGDLRNAIQTVGATPRTIVFTKGGWITLNHNLKVIGKHNLTIAGQTAPGGGIGVRSKRDGSKTGTVFLYNCTNWIVRHFRIRPGDNSFNSQEGDGLTVGRGGQDMAWSTWDKGGQTMIWDHCSFGWGNDEIASFFNSTNITVQWSSLTEALTHNATPLHNYAGMFGVINGTIHHTLYALCSQRAPLIAESRSTITLQNNVVYGFQDIVGGGWEYSISGAPSGYHTRSDANLIGYYVKAGAGQANPMLVAAWMAEPPYGGFVAGDGPRYYMASNYVASGSYAWTDLTANNWSPETGSGNSEHAGLMRYAWSLMTVAPYYGPNVLDAPTGMRYATRYDLPFVRFNSPADLMSVVLGTCGAGITLVANGVASNRDSTDTRVVNHVVNGTGSYLPFETSPQAGGYPTLAAGTPLDDSDHDGMADSWELGYFKNAQGVGNLTISNGRGDSDLDGYTDLEEFINATNPVLCDSILVDQVTGVEYSPCGPPPPSGPAVLTSGTLTSGRFN